MSDTLTQNSCYSGITERTLDLSLHQTGNSGEMVRKRGKTYTIYYQKSEKWITQDAKQKQLSYSRAVFDEDKNQFQQGFINGIYYFPNGDKYDGQWKNNVFQGKGTYYYANGDYYEGQWKQGLKDGKGIFSTNGNKYEGQFKKDMKSGTGTQFFKNGDVYIGYWKNNLFEGRGYLYYHTGVLYDGKWKNGRKHGISIFVFRDGSKQISVWHKGRRCKIIDHFAKPIVQ